MTDMLPPRRFTLNFVGDVMLGRLVDQLFPQHVNCTEDARIISTFLQSHPYLRTYTPKHPWGSTLPLFQTSSLNLINLETSATTHPIPWPNKAFNYRMHPANVEALQAARVDYASLANNHTLDFCTEGLLETVQALRAAGIAFAGGGRSREEALRPAELTLPRDGQGGPSSRVRVWSGADHPRAWGTVPSFHLIDYSTKTRERLKDLLKPKAKEDRAALNIFSVHWGPNYSWWPDDAIQALAHYLVDECDIDIVHGHSSHHLQGVEKYRGKLILYGCGDFVDDYAVTPQYRNDLGAVWRVTVMEQPVTETKETGRGLLLETLEVFPSRIKNFQAELLGKDDSEHEWVRRKIANLSREFGTGVEKELGDEGQLVINLQL